jgi:CTD small phosphatase-like protein 2
VIFSSPKKNHPNDDDPLEDMQVDPPGSILTTLFSPAFSLLKRVSTGIQEFIHDPDTTEDASQTSSILNAEFLHMEEHELLTFMLLATPPRLPDMFRPHALPPQTRSSPPITLVLDLDETLAHCTFSPMDRYDVQFPVTVDHTEYVITGRLRPHCMTFLERVSKDFEVVLFTASQRVYADKLLNLIDPKRQYIKYRLFRESCMHVDGYYFKELSVLGRDLSQVVIVDNAPQAFAYQLQNGIPIRSWYDDDDDTELLSVYAFLESLVGVQDVRPLVDQYYQMNAKVNRFQQLYL